MFENRPRRQRGEPDAGLHVEHAGAVELSALALQRHPRELPDRPHRVEVAEQQDLLRAVSERDSQMIPGGRRRYPRDRAAERFEPRGELSAATVHRCGIVAGGLDRHEGFGELQQPLMIGEAVVEVGAHGDEVLRS